MIVTCDGCHTKYLLDDEKVPDRGIRVRCPKCRKVWRLMPAVDRSVFETSSSEFLGEAPVVESAKSEWASLEQSVSALAGRMGQPLEEESVLQDDVPKAAVREKAAEDPEARKKKERSKRLARVFVSDILVYNKDKRDKGLADGDLMTVLGPEIKKAWEAYKEKVGPNVVESTDYFRDALNEILADGRKVF
ncbi:MAG: zinc-ribbon domain-containing protein [Candidatus Krumholzibacteria bacterium]|nr:zinc-ribbon domain-containing protein [Candidatus Krumholzibacteria bacterium]